MPTLLWALSYVASAAAFVFVALSLASGLLWLAELIEENTKLAKTIGTRLAYVVMALHVALWLSDSLPLHHIVFSVFCHLVYLQNFGSTWPLISLTSWSFIGSCILVVADHFLWFFHFAHKNSELRRRGGTNRPPFHHNSSLSTPHSFTEIASFFGICVWLIPLFLFLSLSANDNALPTSTGDASLPSTPTIDLSQKQVQLAAFPRQSLFKTLVDPLFDVLAVLRLRRKRRADEGIIAPRTPGRSPIHSPIPRTPTSGVGLGFVTDDAGQVLTSPSTEWRGPTTRLKAPPPPRRATTDAVSLAQRAAQNSVEAKLNGDQSPRDGLRPRSKLGRILDNSSPPSPLVNGVH